MFLDVNDEFSGLVSSAGRLTFDLPQISVRGLIHERIRMELERLAEVRAAGPIAVTLSAEERRLNHAVQPSPLGQVLIDDQNAASPSPSARQLRTAEEAFLANRFFVLVGGRQAESLDELVDLESTSEVTFLLLTPLKGG